jgi:DNA-binding CsgD family transcriptional regulator/tetratricopeptide (TPR) repeat protein
VVSTVLVGRESELELLEDAVARAARGGSSMTLLRGEAGLGKTRLVRELETRAAARGAHTLRGECMPLSDRHAYAAIVGALRSGDRAALESALDRLPASGRGEVARLVPDLASAARELPQGDPGEFARARLFELLLILLRELSAQTPVLLTVEDVHWADPSTIDFLVFLAHNLSEARLAVVVTYRPEDRSPELRRVLDELGRRTATELQLEPLAAEHVERQLDAILGRPAERALRDSILRRSGGNPFYVEELLAAGHGDRLPQTVREALLMRLDGLPEDALRILRALAAIARPAPYGLLRAVSGVPEPQLSALLRAAEGQHIVEQVAADAYAFRHALMREAVAGTLTPGERVALHAAVAAELVTGGDEEPAELAYHWEGAEQPASALRAHVRAGLEAEGTYAFGEAREHFARARELSGQLGRLPSGVALDAAGLLAREAEAARLAGDCEEAAERCREALALVDAEAEPVRAAMLHERLGSYLFWDDDGALAAYAEAQRLLPQDRRRERARITSAAALTLHNMARWDDAREQAQAALAVAEEAGAAGEAAHAHLTLGTALAFLGAHEEGERHVRTAARLVEQHGTVEDRARVRSHLAEVLRLRGRIEDALDVMLEGEQAMSRLGMEASFGRSMALNAAEDLLWLGRWEEVDALLRRTVRLQLRDAARVLHCTVSAQLAVARGHREEAQEHIDAALANADEVGADYLVALRAATAELALWERRPRDALDELTAALRDMGDRRDPLYTPQLYVLLGRAAADAASATADTAGPRETARAHVAELDELIARHARSEAPAIAVAAQATCRAELGRLAGERDAGAWSAAVDAWTALSMPYQAAYAQWRLGEAHARAGAEAATVAAALDAAERSATRLGAVPLSQEISRTRADEGLGAPRVRPRRARTAGPYGLTARELDVLALVAQGCSNKQIGERLVISEHTARKHVEHIRDKLAVHNRTTAAHAAQRMGLLDTLVEA